MLNSTSRSTSLGRDFTTLLAVICLLTIGCTAEQSAPSLNQNPDPLAPQWDASASQDQSGALDAGFGVEDLGESDAGTSPTEIDEGTFEDTEESTPESIEWLNLEQPTAFRISSLWVSAPPLCISLSEDHGCVNMEALANAALTASLLDPLAPLDIVGILTTPEEGGPANLEFGQANCQRENGLIKSCSIKADQTDYGPVYHSEEKNCWPTKEDYKSDSAWMAPAPCFYTDEKAASLHILGNDLSVHEMQLLGHIKDSDEGAAVTTGQIISFLPEEVATNVVMTMENPNMVEEISLADLLHSKAMVMHSSGQMGWNVVLSFDAEKVPIK